MDEKLVVILNEMAEVLSIAQMKKLQEVLLKNLSDNAVSKEDIDNTEYLQMFLDAKKIEGCSGRTIDYYRSTIETFYYDGKPDGIRWIKRELSPITAYVIPRALYLKAKKVKGIERPGVYFLLAENEDGVVTKMYICQTELGISRLDDHIMYSTM